eukprot:TRINITY_DN184_c0_g1_i9.p1 TRINITY_DN184_c0_g1~~TRINITY_DN184_c0_g1_i9.p1  ORF type:complete len:401 (+),score=55.59 TRINITY_DN184_c0_g1_i9:306-1508(+)
MVSAVARTLFRAMRPRGVRMLPRYSCACPVCEGAAQTRQRLTYALNGIHKDCSDCARDSSCPAERRVPANSKARVSLNELRTKVAEIEEHESLFRHQDKAYRNMKESLPPGRALVVMDFAAKQALPMRWNTFLNEFISPPATMSDLVIVVMWRDQAGGSLQYKYLDYVSEDHQDTAPFVRHVWYLLLADPFMRAFAEIDIWSDGGPHHYKVNETFGYMAELAVILNKTIRWHFFPSYHGKGPCDGHTGLWKQRARERLRENPVPLASAAALKPIIESLSNTACRVLETINREKNADSWQPNIYGMKSYHEFHFSKPADSDFRQGGYFVFGRRRFGDGPYVFWNISHVIAGAAQRVLRYYPLVLRLSRRERARSLLSLLLSCRTSGIVINIIHTRLYELVR